MDFTSVQSYLVTRIAAASALAAFCPPAPAQVARLYNPLENIDVARSDIGDRNAQMGVCFEIGFPRFSNADTNTGGQTFGEVICDVFVTESFSKAHTPQLASLVQETILACTAVPQVGQKPARLRAEPVEPVITEEGYVLHWLSFYVPVILKPSHSISSPQV